jgi:hypothetical protein
MNCEFTGSRNIIVVAVGIVIAASTSACRQSESPDSGTDASRSPQESGMASGLRARSDNLFELPIEDQSLESLAPQGRWLVFLYATWDANATANISVLPKVADAVKGDVRVGIRSYASYDELRQLCSGFEIASFEPTPFWILLDNGELVGEEVSYLSEKEAIEFVRHGFEESSASDESSIEP